MPDDDAMVFVIDDDAEVRGGIGSLCRSIGLNVRVFASTEDFLAQYAPNGPACLILDVRFPGTSATGLEFQRAFSEAGMVLPIVFISGHADVRMGVEAMKHGAVEFLTKPFREQELLDAVRLGLERDRARLAAEECVSSIREQVDRLTERQRQIMLLMAEGLAVKQIAGELGLSEVTVKVHRARVMQQLKVRSAIDIARMVDRLNAARGQPTNDLRVIGKEHTAPSLQHDIPGPAPPSRHRRSLPV